MKKISNIISSFFPKQTYLKNEWRNLLHHYQGKKTNCYKWMGKWWLWHSLRCMHCIRKIQRYSSSFKIYEYLNKFICIKNIKTMVLTFKNIMYMCTIFLRSHEILGKEKCILHNIPRLTVFTCALCHTRVENLLKGPA